MFDDIYLVNGITDGYPEEFTATKDGYVVIEAACYSSSSAPSFEPFSIGIYPIN